MDPFSQELRLREAGVQRGQSLARHRRLRGHRHGPAPRLAPPGRAPLRRRYPGCGPHRQDRPAVADTLLCIIALRARGVKISSLDETEGWTRFPELAPDDPMAFVGHQMVGMAAWVADQGRDVGRRRTKEGLAAARARGKTLGQDPGTPAVSHRRPGAAGPAHEGRRRFGENDRRAPGG